MAKLEQIQRLLFIAEFLKSKPNGITYEETKNYLEKRFTTKGYQLKFSEKTFQRDRELISEILGIESVFKRSSKTFEIQNDELEWGKDYVLDNVLLIDAYRNAQQNTNIILFEKRKPTGLHNFSSFIEAIKKHHVVSFQYLKFYEDEPEKRVIVPYALKEFKNRWYLLGHDFKSENQTLKTFGLDRISNIEIHHTRQLRKTKNIENAFVNSFGIISTLEEKPEEIILSFNVFQGNYIKSLPLHHSQEIIEENENELIIKLNLVPTFDFKQEILSFGESVKIISPKSFKNEIVKEIQNILHHYKN